MKGWLLCVLAVVCASCGDPSVTAPSVARPDGSLTVLVAPRLEPVQNAGEPLNGVTVSGPSGCVDVATLPAVVSWEIAGLPAGAELEKAYHFDDSVTCDSTEQQQRTQNSHLRIVRTSATSVRVDFDRDTERCTGRQQVDISLDGHVLIGVVLTRAKGNNCRKPPTCPVGMMPQPGDPSHCVRIPEYPKTCPTNPDVCPPPPPPPPEDPPVCPKPREHHCENTSHRNCQSDACRRDRCHEKGHR